MKIVGVLAVFVLVGIAVVFIAFSGGPGKARQAYLTRATGAFRLLIPLIYVVAILVVPALVILDREEAKGGTDQLATSELAGDEERGKQLFMQTCASCHSLQAVNSRGVTGPSLDEIGEVTPERIEQAIRLGGTGQKRMPANLLQGEDAEAVALFVSRTAGN